MPAKRPRSVPPPATFDVPAFFKDAGVPTRTVQCDTGTPVFTQGSEASAVFYLMEGDVTLVVVSPAGKEAVVAMLGPREFLGEGCLAGQRRRMGSAKAVAPAVLLQVAKADMQRVLHDHPAFADHFLGHVLTRNIRIEQDLVDHLFNSSEKRLARTLLLLSRYGTNETMHLLPKLSQETLAEMVGTTRSRVNFFMNKFRRLGFIEYNGVLKVNSALLSVVLHD